MPKLYRPHIPLSVRCKVAERQLREAFLPLEPSLDDVPTKPLARRLRLLLEALVVLKGCEVSDLRLDHDPPLGGRPRHRRGLNPRTFYTPDANDPDHLFYRPHGPEHEGSHLIKTNVRGDHGQHPDRVLIKKQRRLEKPPRAKKKARFSSSRKIPNAGGFRSGANKLKPKPKWGTRRFRNIDAVVQRGVDRYDGFRRPR